MINAVKTSVDIYVFLFFIPEGNLIKNIRYPALQKYLPVADSLILLLPSNHKKKERLCC